MYLLRCSECKFGPMSRLILLASICLSPIRLAFDHDGVEPAYRRAVALLAADGFEEFTNYVLYSYTDTLGGLYRRMAINLELSEQPKVRVTGFPKRHIPTEDVKRGHVGPNWHWRYLRGIQYVLLATHGIVSPHRQFFNAAFGEDEQEFHGILSMPNRYIFRKRYKAKAQDWRGRFRKLGVEKPWEFLDALEGVHRARHGADEAATGPQPVPRASTALLSARTRTQAVGRKEGERGVARRRLRRWAQL